MLLAVSCGIVLRSFILRRRFRRRVEAAIAAGVLLPEQVEALRRRGPNLGERPTLWEVRIGKGGANAAVDGIAKSGYEQSISISDKTQDDDWAYVMVGRRVTFGLRSLTPFFAKPISAAIIPASLKKSSESSPPAPIPVPYSTEDEDLLRSRRPRWLRLGRNNNSGSLLPMTAPPPPPETLPPATGNTEASPITAGTPGLAPTALGAENLDKLQLTVLIAMPNANVPRYQPSMSHASATADIQLGDRTISPVEIEKIKEANAAVEVADDDDEEDEIPEVVFGITEVLWDAGTDWKPRVGKADDSDEENGSSHHPTGGGARTA